MANLPPEARSLLAWTRAATMIITALQLLLAIMFMATNGQGTVGGKPVGRFPPTVVAGALLVITGCCAALFAGWASGHGVRWSLWTLTVFNFFWLVAVVVAPFALTRNMSGQEAGWEIIGYAVFFGGPGLILGFASLVLVLRILLNAARFQWFRV